MARRYEFYVRVARTISIISIVKTKSTLKEVITVVLSTGWLCMQKDYH